MQTLLRAGTAMLLGLAALALAPSAVSARPRPGPPANSGFRLFARSLGVLTANRVYCGLNASGQVCADSPSSSFDGGLWPKGTPDLYIYSSGLQLAGIIGSDGGAWAGDTTGAFFFDPKGTTEHGEAVTDIYNSSDSADLAAWPHAARVPPFDFYAKQLQFTTTEPDTTKGRTVSQGDAWWLSWEGNPANNAGRHHPLGVLVSTRGMGWNYPAGNQDILYFVFTVYNITSLNPADYSAAPLDLQPALQSAAESFQNENEEKFGIAIPDEGYTIRSLYAGMTADMDVGIANQNYSSVNLPFAMGYTYEMNFDRPSGWVFDRSIFAPPFFEGTGFAGIKYLNGADGPGEIQLYSNLLGGGTFGDPDTVTQLYRYLSGNISPIAGDAPCVFLDPLTEHVCYINNAAGTDTRFLESSAVPTLAPGQFASVVVAYIFAAPVSTPGFTPGPGANLKPGDPTKLADATGLAAGDVNTVDKLTGFISYEDVNGDGKPQQAEFTVVPGSLLGKAQVAQAVFNAKFLLPSAPAAPDFFLVPGDHQVTVMWRKSAAEDQGDPFFSTASQALNLDGTVNPLFDPSYRQFDVEGYRIYRGRAGSHSPLELLAQFDYAGTSISDFYGLVNPVANCAPELGIPASPSAACPFSAAIPGVTPTDSVIVPLTGEVVQTKVGGRVRLADTSAFILTGSNNVDTAVVSQGFPALRDTGVPFVYVDHDVRNYFHYVYSVTAFDVNSFTSGPSSFESARITKSVTPQPNGANVTSTGKVTAANLVGRGKTLDTAAAVPTIDPTTGIFSGPFPPANGWSAGLGALVSQVLQPGNYTVQLDSIILGDPYGSGAAHQYWYSVPGTTAPPFVVSLPQEPTTGADTATTNFSALPINGNLASRFGGNGSFLLPGQVQQYIDGAYYTGTYGRGCVNAAPGFDQAAGCEYNGSRWFDGPSPTNNETLADPIAGNTVNFDTIPMINYNNAGALTGVVTIFQPQPYQSMPSTYRAVTAVLGGARRAADYNVYWGAGGAVDSVVDITHNVVVPFDSVMGGTWGFLNANASALEPDSSADGSMLLTTADFGCVAPLLAYGSGPFPCAASQPYKLSNTAVPAAVGFFSGGGNADPTSAVAAPNAGMGMYLAGDVFLFELQGGAVPAAGTVWSLRSYIGAISGGHGAAGDRGAYTFSNPEGWRTMAAVGAQLQVSFDVTNQLAEPTDSMLANVHTVPDPYYVMNEFEQSTDAKILKFVNLPEHAIIRIYSSSGILVSQLESPSADCQNVSSGTTAINPNAGECTWNVRNRGGRVVASGVYFYHVESGNARKIGRFTVVNYRNLK